jgi:hypothetical protein
VADNATDPQQVTILPADQLDHLVEQVANLAGQPLAPGQPHIEPTVLDVTDRGHEIAKQLLARLIVSAGVRFDPSHRGHYRRSRHLGTFSARHKAPLGRATKSDLSLTCHPPPTPRL